MMRDRHYYYTLLRCTLSFAFIYLIAFRIGIVQQQQREQQQRSTIINVSDESSTSSSSSTTPRTLRTHDIAKQKNHHDSSRSKKNKKMKVFGIGLSKTGSTSMMEAFKMLGYTTLHTDRKFGHFMHHHYHNNDNETTTSTTTTTAGPSAAAADLSGYYDDVDSVWDVPTSAYYKEIYDAYPNARYILTTRRDANTWYEAFVKRYIQGYMIPLKWSCHVPIRVQRLYAKIYGSPFPSTDWIHSYEKHNQEVQEYFAQHAADPSQLLVVNMDDEPSDVIWEKVCRFIERTDGPCHKYSSDSTTSWLQRLRYNYNILPQHTPTTMLQFPNIKEDLDNENNAFIADTENCAAEADGSTELTVTSSSTMKVKDEYEGDDDDEMRYAYVTILCEDNPSYDRLRILLVLMENIRQFDTESDIVLLVYGNISSDLWKLLRRVGFTLRRISTVGKKIIPFDPYSDEVSACHRAKLHVLRLIQYDRVLFIDNDMLIMLQAGITVLFDEQYQQQQQQQQEGSKDRIILPSSSSFVAYQASPNNNDDDDKEEPIHGGVMSIRPSENAFVDVSDIVRSGSFDPINGWLDYGPLLLQQQQQQHHRDNNTNNSNNNDGSSGGGGSPYHNDDDTTMVDWSFPGATIHRGVLYYYYDKLLQDATILSSRHDNSDGLFSILSDKNDMNEPFRYDDRGNLDNIQSSQLRNDITEWYRLWDRVENHLLINLGIDISSFVTIKSKN